jgi:diketogulonate reductase-like aldo/keto reductase
MIPTLDLPNGFSIPSFGLGTWRMGGVMEKDPDNDDSRDIAAIRRAIDAGITLIDTAEMYAAGHTEEMVGKAIEGVDRSSLFITSKVSPQNLEYDDVLRAAEGSLKRLGTDYLDLYLVHHPNPRIAQPDTMRALDALAADGRIKWVGVSNFSTERMRRAQAVCKHPIVLNQVHLSLVYREPDVSGLSAYCRENGIVLQAWRPLQHIVDEPPAILRSMAEKYDKTPAQVAISWLLTRPLTGTLCKMTKRDHLEENLEGVGWKLSIEDEELLTREYPDQRDVSDSVPLK